MNILYIGDYIPHQSFDTLQNILLTNELKFDNEVFFLSDAWCYISSDNFACRDMKTLECNENLFQLDPYDLKIENNSRCNVLINLIFKVVAEKKIQQIYISDIMAYGWIIPIIKERFNVSIVSCIFSDRISRYFLFEQIKDVMKFYLDEADKIISYSMYYSLLRDVVNDKNKIVIIPVNIDIKINTKEIYAIHENESVLKKNNNFLRYQNLFKPYNLKDIQYIEDIFCTDKSINRNPENLIFCDLMSGNLNIGHCVTILNSKNSLPILFSNIKKVETYYNICVNAINDEIGIITSLREK